MVGDDDFLFLPKSLIQPGNQVCVVALIVITMPEFTCVFETDTHVHRTYLHVRHNDKPSMGCRR